MAVTEQYPRAESGALVAAGLSALAAILVAIVILSRDGVWLSGDGSVGMVGAITAGAAGVPVLAVSYVRSNRTHRRRRARTRAVLDTIAVTLAGSSTASLLILSAYTVLDLAFRELVLDKFGASVLIAATVAISSYSLFLLADTFDSQQAATLLGLFLAAGVMASALTAGVPWWWQWNFSALGAGTAFSARAFNITLIVAGLILVALADMLTTDLRPRRTAGRRARGRVIVRTLLVVIGIALMGVGFVRVDISVILHNSFAALALVGFGVLFAVTPTLVAGLPRSFSAASMLLTGALVVAVLLWIPIGYYNLTAAELVAVLILFVWLVLLARSGAAASAARRTEVPSATGVGTAAMPSRPVRPVASARFVGGSILLGAVVFVCGLLIGSRPRDDR